MDATSASGDPASPEGDAVGGFLGRARPTKKCGYIAGFLAVLILIIIVIVIVVVTEDKGTDIKGNIESSALGGDGGNPTAAPDTGKSTGTTLKPKKLTAEGLDAIVNNLKDLFSDGDATKQIIKNARTKTMQTSLKTAFLADKEASEMLSRSDNSLQSPKDVKEILQKLVNNQLQPMTEALTGRSLVGGKPHRMGPELIFSRPMDTDEDFFLTTINKTYSELMNNGEFVGMFERFWNDTFQTMNIHHFDTVGEEAGEDLAGDVDNPTDEDRDWLEEIHGVLTGYEDMSKTTNISERIFDVEDHNRMMKIWNDVIESKKEFGHGQLLLELVKYNGVEVNGSDLAPVDADEARVMILKEKLKNQQQAVLPGGRMDSSDPGTDVIVATSPVECNPDTEYRCDNGLGCYDVSRKCDRYINCADNSDEQNCTCKEYLEPGRHCDGFEDCLDGEDEKECNCSKEDFFCQPKELGSECVPGKYRCDRILDCKNGRDEEFCFELGPEGQPLDPQVAWDPHSKGIVHVKTTDGWRVLSIEFGSSSKENINIFLQNLSETVCSDSVTLSKMTPKFRLITIDQDSGYDRVANLRLDLDDENAHLIQANQGTRYMYDIAAPYQGSQVIGVDCGEQVCGVKSGRRSFSGNNGAQDGLDRKDRANLVEPRIVGGVDSGFGNWPFAVAILRDGKFICGGTIVHQEWIVTAAHCLFDVNSHFQVVAGLYRRMSRSPLESVKIIDRILIHDDYNHTWLSNDIAMAHVREPFSFSYAISPICIPDDDICSTISDNEVKRPSPGERCVAVGWGQTSENGPTSDELRQVDIPVLGNCKSSFNDIKYQVCGGYEEGGKDSCLGDSGGPLLCRNRKMTDSWYLGGVVSHGIGCARESEPGVYTRVCEYLDFINGVMEPLQQNAQPSVFQTSNPMCPTTTCDGGKCIESKLMCDVRVNCFDGTDEVFCQVKEKGVREYVEPRKQEENQLTTEDMTPEVSSTDTGSIHRIRGILTPCSSEFFQCKKIYQCIDKNLRCNGNTDCKDKSDEIGCTCKDFLQGTSQICDGHPDCEDWGDEVGCDYCADERAADPNERYYHCRDSNSCIKYDYRCDRRGHQCSQWEDERYCISIINGDQVTHSWEDKPVQYNEGLVASNYQGAWELISPTAWDKHISDRICQYTGKRESISFTLVPMSDYPHLIGKELSVRRIRSRAKRYLDRPEFAPEGVFDEFMQHDAGHVQPLAFHLGYQLGNYSRRVRQSASRHFIRLECSPHPPCGTPLLYSMMGLDNPTFGVGVFPWQATLYLNGEYLCGATLVHQDWVLMGEGCAIKVNPPADYLIARMGGYRLSFKSGHEQLARIIHITKIPGTKVYLGKFARSVVLSQHINFICIPDARWIPRRTTKCVITGKSDVVLNHSYEMQVTGVCERKSPSNYQLCARKVKEDKDKDECLNGWSGALACPDDTGRYYAVGLYHNEGCKPPRQFVPLVSRAVRSGLENVIRSADNGTDSYSDMEDTDCLPRDGKMRCPLGKCLNNSQICDGHADCTDFSDEREDMCQSKGPPVCAHLNSTHCRCPGSKDMLCRNSVCIHKSKYCDQHDDCGDGSDEPPGCSTDCSLALDIMEPSKICDNRIDCTSFLDLGNDESAKRCCQGGKSYRCMMGNPMISSNNEQVSFLPGQCLDSQNVCDGDPFGAETCVNGADEADCISIWPGALKKTTGNDSQLPLDPFGRFKSGVEGYLYIVYHGRSFLYCASPVIFKPERLNYIGKALCDHEGYRDLTSIVLHEPGPRQRVDSDNQLPLEEKKNHFRKCQLVYLVCSMGKDKML